MAGLLTTAIKRLTKASKVFDDKETFEVARLCEASKAYLHEDAKRLVAAAGPRAVLYSYGADSTPCLGRFTLRRRLNTGKWLVRTAKKGTDWLLEKGYARYITDIGAQRIRFITRDPRPLQDKHAPTYLTAFREFFPQLKLQGHKGISITHLAMDRAIFSSVARLIGQLHTAMEERQGEEWGEYGANLNWLVTTACANHDVQNAQHWSLMPLLEDQEQSLKDFHVVVESLRNAYDILIAYLPNWLQDKIAWDTTPINEWDVGGWWKVMGVEDPVMYGELVALNLHWEGGALWVNSRHKNDPDIMTRVQNAILYLWLFRKFTESRWCTVGLVSKAITASLSVGLDDLVVTALAAGCKTYHIHGFAKLGAELRTPRGQALNNPN